MFVYLLLYRGGRSSCWDGGRGAVVACRRRTENACSGGDSGRAPEPLIRDCTAVMCNRPSDEGSEPGTADSSQANLNRYRLHLYNYALQAERLRLSGGWGTVCPVYPGTAASIYPPRFPVALFHPGVVGSGGQNADEPKPQHSYIGLIAMAILGSAEGKLVLSDIYQYILDNYPYFRTRGPGWRNSIRHNLSLNDCFVKAGRSANGKGHYWAIHPANVDDFKKGDFRRRKAQRKVRRHMGLAVDDDGNDSPSPPPQPPPPPPQQQHPLPPSMWPPPLVPQPGGHQSPFYFQSVVAPQPMQLLQLQQQSAPIVQARAHKRQFDVASLLAPDPPKRLRNDPMTATTTTTTTGSSEDEDEMTTCVRNGGGGGWEPVGLLQRYYEHQLQTAHRLHAIRQSLGLHRMIGGGGGGGDGAGPWPTVIVQDRNMLETPTPPSQSYCTTATTPDDSIKTELVD